MLNAKIIFALLYDLLLLFAVWFFAALPFVIWQGPGFEKNPLTLVIFQLYLVMISYVYLSYFWLQTGQTPGLRTWKLRLVRLDGYLPTRHDANKRFFFSLISIASLGLGWIWLFFNNQGQTLHDRLSHTQIIHSEHEG
ncbi:RDD family protein [Thiomicrospira microaerophila]|uniref:RDD family protein n=1 Tax=Thiomicrospira microaerophila TaxID=406020 RepID=UPI00200FD5BF|nr:RDD family protein [Thiomicrospira microaerophila]UQB42999.1 RDD family protein [Thiomicrospira microaerophila]